MKKVLLLVALLNKAAARQEKPVLLEVQITLSSHIRTRYLTKTPSDSLFTYYKSYANQKSGLIQQDGSIAVARYLSLFDKQGNMDIEKQAGDAMSKLAFTAAEIDGKAVPVRMVYRVFFNGTADRVTATIIPNSGSMQARYGRDYVTPQERLDVSDWYARYNKNSFVNGGEFLDEGPLSSVAATVDEKGNPSSVRTLDVERAFKCDADIVKTALRRSRFIPGFVDGKPVSMVTLWLLITAMTVKWLALGRESY